MESTRFREAIDAPLFFYTMWTKRYLDVAPVSCQKTKKESFKLDHDFGFEPRICDLREAD
jgi:hypothetical protein